MKYVKLHYPQGTFTAAILPGLLIAPALIVVFSSRIIRSAAADKPETATPSAPRRSGEIDLAKHYGKLPLSFEANAGQADLQVKFLARGHGYDLFLTTTEAILVLRDAESAKSESLASASRSSISAQSRSVLRLKLLGANRQPAVAAESELPGKVNYLIGNNRAQWRSDISTYSRVLYAEVYPHIDLAYYGNQQRIEYDFIVAPDAHPGRIRMFFSGARKVAVDKSGDLILSTDAGDMQLRKPLAYQEINGQRHSVNARYHLQGRHVGFELGQYDRRHPLVIDPVLSYASYLGGTFNDQAYDIAVDSVGNAYVTGSTYATDFPITPGALQTSTVGIGNDLGGGGFAQTDVFITKFNAAGNAVIYSTYLGGTDSTDRSLFFVLPARGNDEPRGIAFVSDGQPYITC